MTVKEETEKPWSFELVNKEALIKAFAAGRVPDTVLAVNLKQLSQWRKKNDC